VGRPRRPFKFWAITAIGVGFSLVGLLLLILGADGETRLR
jgi:hypothetical protein